MARLLYINFDGFAQYYYDLADIAKVPNLVALVSQSRFFSHCSSLIPSITVPMQDAIVSGASSALTRNCYGYYDKEASRFVLCGRHNSAETVAEVLASAGRDVLSIQQFGVEEHGCTRGDIHHLYLQPGGTYEKRFDILEHYLSTGRVEYDGTLYASGIPYDMVMLYCDDLDTVGHRGGRTEEERVGHVLSRLYAMDERLGRVMRLLKEKGLYEDTAILLTADHGMVKMEGKTKRKELEKAIHDAFGYRLSDETGNLESSDVLVTCHSISAQLFVSSSVDVASLKECVSRLDFVDKVLDREELEALGCDGRYADLMVSPKEGCYFSDDIGPFVGASHDSLHEKAQHVFALFKDGKHVGEVNGMCHINDLMPTAVDAVFSLPMDHANGRILR